MYLIQGIRVAFSRMISESYATAAAIGIMSVIFMVFGMFLLAFYNINLLADDLKRDMQVITYMNDGIDEEGMEKIRNQILQFEEVENIHYISKEHALDMLSQDIVSIREMVGELKRNPLPDSFRISLVKKARNPDGIGILVDKLRNIEEVQDIDYGKEWVERLDALITTMRVIGIIVGGIMIVVVLFIVSNTIKFTLLTRRKEIDIMKSVGATDLFIKVPFVIEGGIFGLISSLCSLVMLFFTYKLILYKIPAAMYEWLGGVEFIFIPWEAAALMIGAGTLVGCFGSMVSAGRFLGVAIILFLCLNMTSVVHAKGNDIEEIDSQGIEKRIKENQRKLEDINKQISEKKRESKKAAAEEKKIEKTIKSKERDLSVRKKDIKEVSKKISSKEEEIDDVKDEINMITTEIDARKRSMEEFLRQVYKSHIGEKWGTTRTFLASSDYHDFIMRSKYEDRMVAEVNRVIKDLGREVDISERQLHHLNRRYHSLLSEKDKQIRDKAKVEKDVSSNRVKLASIQEKKAMYEKELKKLADASGSLKDLLTVYEKRRKQLALINTGFAKQKGHLIWPLNGNISSKFGKQKHPEFDAFVFKKGIEIVSDKDRKVRAVFDGEVAFADWLKGYGLIIIVDHGSSYYSVYAHASRLLVSTGSKVKKGDHIAIAGNDNSSFAGQDGIYFELRHNGQAIDPIAWLSTSR